MAAVMYHSLHSTADYEVKTSRIGDVVIINTLTGAEVYIQPGDEANTSLDEMEKYTSTDTLNEHLAEYFG